MTLTDRLRLLAFDAALAGDWELWAALHQLAGAVGGSGLACVGLDGALPQRWR